MIKLDKAAFAAMRAKVKARSLSELLPAALILPVALPLLAAIGVAEMAPGLGVLPKNIGLTFVADPLKHLVHRGDLLTYGAVGLLHMALCLAAIWAIWRWITQLKEDERKRAGTALQGGLVFGVVLVVVIYIWTDELALIQVTFKAVCELLKDANLGTSLVRTCTAEGITAPLTLLAWVPTFAGMLTVAFALALTAGLAGEIPDSEDERTWRGTLERRSKRLQKLLYLLSAVLVTSTLCMVQFTALPVKLVAGKEPQAAIAAFAQGLGAFWGVVFALTLIACIMPAGLLLHREAQGHSSGSEDFSDWLREHVYGTAGKQIGNVLVLLAPLLAGPVGGLVGNFFG